IETMIAVSVFIVIVLSGMGALLNANLLYQKSQNMRSIMDNLSFIMEDMSRNVRTGYHYRCYFNVNETIDPAVINVPRSCSGGWGLAFEAAPPNGNTGDNSDQWVYSIGTYYGKTGIFKSTDGSATFTQLTPDIEVVIDTVASGFSVLGAEASPGNQQQPLVTIRLVGTITVKNVVTPFSLQTSVSQRLLDL
ncbi:MAG TPA: hypothetical protein VGO21_04585, partial [Candidatus Paceibacterota bacterium]|nr:hypothetical protein [Candidatus Paceibacterota bacterium]